MWPCLWKVQMKLTIRLAPDLLQSWLSFFCFSVYRSAFYVCVCSIISFQLEKLGSPSHFHINWPGCRWRLLMQYKVQSLCPYTSGLFYLAFGDKEWKWGSEMRQDSEGDLGAWLELRDERHIIEPSLPPTVLPGEMASWRKTLNRCEIDHLFVFLGQNNIRADTKSGT